MDLSAAVRYMVYDKVLEPTEHGETSVSDITTKKPTRPMKKPTKPTKKTKPKPKNKTTKPDAADVWASALSNAEELHTDTVNMGYTDDTAMLI